MKLSPKQQAILDRVRSEIRVEKVVSTCTIGNNRDGSSFLGYSCARASTKEESDTGLMGGAGTSGWTLDEVQLVRVHVAYEATLGALKDALIRGSISTAEYEPRLERAKKYHAKQIRLLLPEDEDNTVTEMKEAPNGSENSEP